METDYYPVPDHSQNTLIDALCSVGVDNSFSNRRAIADSNGILDYVGTAIQDMAILKLLRSGKLKKNH